MLSLVRKILLTTLLLLGSSTLVFAGLIEYTFEGEYHDGSKTSGTFFFDDTTNVYSNALIELDGGSNYSSSIFDYIHYTSPNAIVLLDSSDGPLYNDDNVFHIILQGGELFGELTPNNVYSDIASCDKNHCPARNNLDVAISATLTGQYVEVPEPGNLLLLSLGLCAFFIRRKKYSA